jgi:hypothetical protein
VADPTPNPDAHVERALRLVQRGDAGGYVGEVLATEVLWLRGEEARLSADLTEARRQVTTAEQDNGFARADAVHWKTLVDRYRSAIEAAAADLKVTGDADSFVNAVLAVLDPVEAAPQPTVRCEDCNGTGLDATHRQARPTLDCDHIYCPIHGDVGYDRSHAWCETCKGAGKVGAPAASPPATAPTLADECEKWAQERWGTSYSAADLLTRAAAALRAGASPPAEPPPATPPIEDDAHDPEAWGRAPATEPEATPDAT